MTTIMVVDDEDAIRNGIVFVLKHRGYTVLEARNGEECLNMLKESTVDLLILDIKMPVIDGPETLKRIRQQDAYKDIPILVYSAFLTPESEAALAQSATDVLKKPVDISALINLVTLYTAH